MAKKKNDTKKSKNGIICTCDWRDNQQDNCL